METKNNKISDESQRDKTFQASASFLPKRSSFTSLKYLFPYLKRYKKYALGALGFVFLSGFVTLFLPFAIRMMIDHGFREPNVDLMHSYFGILFFVVLLLALATAGRLYVVSQLGENIVKDLRQDIFKHLIGLSPGFYDTAHSGELVSRLSSDTTLVKTVLSGTASIALRNVIMLVGAVFMMFVSNLKLSLMVLIAIPFLVLPLIYWGRKIRGRSRIVQDRIAVSNIMAGEYLGAIRTIQAFAAESKVIQRFSTLVVASYKAALHSMFSRALLTFTTMFLMFSAIIGILWIGAYDVAQNRISAGTLGQFMLYSIFAASALGQLSEVFAQIHQAVGACERLIELLQEKTCIKIAKDPQKLILPIRGDIRFTNVSFAYPSKTDRKILEQISFHIKPGETVAFVGPSGVGKTTIFSLLLRFYDIKGHIYLDGQDIAQLNLQDLRSQFAYVSQDAAIFEGNFYDNIAFGAKEYTEEAIIAAAKTAQAYEFIMQHKEGFQTQLGERGLVLSGGQKQRIALARAILQNAPILLLDEATSALDAQSETFVQHALDTVTKDKTTLVIAHRLATIVKADRIFVLDQAQIKETGNHEQLIKQNGLYARLAKLQFTHKDNPEKI